MTLLSGFHVPFDLSDIMGKPRSSTVTELIDDTDYVNANKVGSHDPLRMTETADMTIPINDHVLAYIVGHIHQRTNENRRFIVLHKV